ncbi:MAG: rRNA maturation RNase YbeY [Gemmatimonadales bacterium]
MDREPSSVAVGGRKPALPAATVARVVGSVLRAERRAADVSVTFLGPVAMRRLNARHLGHDRVTDVISFAMTGPDGRLVGEIAVCRAAAAAEARRRGIRLREELIRLLIHGTLHLLGYDHPESGDRTASPMWRRQERYVRRLTRTAGVRQ